MSLMGQLGSYLDNDNLQLVIPSFEADTGGWVAVVEPHTTMMVGCTMSTTKASLTNA